MLIIILLVDSKEYEELVDLCKARHGSAICIEKVHKKLGLRVLGTYKSVFDFEYVETVIPKEKVRPKKLQKHVTASGLIHVSKSKKKIPLPMEITVWHKCTGFHSVLIIDHEPRVGCYRITNFRHATSLEGWMFSEDLYQYTNRCGRQEWIFRLFGLKKGK